MSVQTNNVLGIGAPIVDRILFITDDFLQKLHINKGGIAFVDHLALAAILDQYATDALTGAGGSGANVIKGMAHLGEKCALTGKIGTDPNAEIFLKNLSALSITSLYVSSSTPTGQVLSLVTPDGERTICSFLGSGGLMTPEDLKEEFFKGMKLVHIEGYTLLNPGLTHRAVEQAKKAGAKVSFDLANYEIVQTHKECIGKLMSSVDILFANADEARALTGFGPEKACSLLKNICEIVVVTLGEKGCCVGHKDQVVRYPVDAVKPLDTTGAGDLFASGFLYGYLKDLPLRECAQLGVRIARAVVQVEGTEIPPEGWNQLKTELNIIS